MLTIILIALILAIPLSSISSIGLSSLSPKGGGGVVSKTEMTISATLYTRIVWIGLLFAAILSYNGFPSIGHADALINIGYGDGGLGLYSGLIHATTVTQSIEVFLLISGALILLTPKTAVWASIGSANSSTIPEYPMIILFTTTGATFLLASADLVSIYLAIELQSFGVYILAALYRDSESATAAGLKYFLLGALSSALILLGSALVYGYSGLTNLNCIYEFISVPINDDTYTQIIILGFLLISIGLLFKVASAPFHYWAPDVYDGTPTIVTTWLTVIPKISIFIFLLLLYHGINTTCLTSASSLFFLATFLNTTYLLLICTFLSLVIGTVVGLRQYRIKRLLAYSTISHVGFILLALSVGSASIMAGEESTEAFLFYIITYTLTNLDTFFILLAFGYVINSTNNTDINFTSELVGQFRVNPILGLSLAICLFSMAGVPPLVGFFAKYTILNSAIHNGYIFLSIIAILASVVSAVYYLRIIRVIYFGVPVTYTINSSTITLTSVHSYIIALITLFILLFATAPTLILNSTSIMALSIYIT